MPQLDSWNIYINMHVSAWISLPSFLMKSNYVAPLSILLELYIDSSSFSTYVFLEFVCYFVWIYTFMLFNVGFTLVVLYSVITKDSCIVLLLLLYIACILHVS